MFDACALIAVVIPTTCPRLLISGPPLLPKLMAASVWMNASRLGSNSLRPRKLTTPTVTECTYPSGLPMAQTHSPTRSVSESPSGATGSGAGHRDSQQRDVDGRVDADELGLEHTAVAKRHRDPIGAFDDVIVGQDVAGRVDDEAAAGTFVRRVRIVAQIAPPPRRRSPARVGAARRGVDVDDRRVHLRGDGREVNRRAARCASAGAAESDETVIGLAASAPGRNGQHVCRTAGARAGRDDAQQKAHDGRERDVADGLAGRHSFLIIRARNAASSSSRTPSDRAFSSLLPASRPTMSPLVFRLMEPLTLPPRRTIASFGVVAAHRVERAGDHERLTGERRLADARFVAGLVLHPHAGGGEPIDERGVRRLVEKRPDRLCHHRSDVGHDLQGFD